MITSTSNPIIKLARALREKKIRQASGLFLIEGLRIVIEACQQNAFIESIIYSPNLLTSERGKQVISDQRKKGSDIIECSEKVFQSISIKEGPQGIAALVHQKIEFIDDLIFQEGDLIIALDSIQDPGNLGTILRTADAVGVKGVILLDQSTDPYDPASIRASMGAIFDQVVVKATLAGFAKWKRNNSIFVIGSSGTAALNYHEFSYPSSLVLLMGSERLGLQKPHYEICDNVVSIPMLGKSDSLNLAIATSIVLYEIFNQKQDRLVSSSKKGEIAK
jgi:TrmH family RNA methyltransferase